MKKFFIFCIAVFQLSLAYGDTKVNINGIYYYLTPEKVGTAEVTRGASEYSGAIVIPETIEYNNFTYIVTSIGLDAFSLSKITSIDIPSTVTFIDNYAFDGCTEINEVKIHSLQSWCSIKFKSNPLIYAKSLLLNGEIINELVIPEDISKISNYAFYDYKSLTSVKIPKNIKAIGEYAFSKCSSLNTVQIEESVDTIYSYAFSDCTSLSDVKLSNTPIIRNYVFSGCTALSSLTLPENIQAVGYGLCYNCKSLLSINIPKNVLAIGDDAFYGCEKLKTIYISESVLAMGTRSFGYCENITDVYCYATTPPVHLSKYYKKGISDFFLNSYINYATLHVPNESIDKYKGAFSWSDFGNVVALTEQETGINSIGITADDSNAAIYNLRGQKQESLQKGINIIKMGNGQTKKIFIK